MDALNEFSIPLKGLKNDTYQYDYQIDNSFFSHFEHSTIKNGKFEIKLDFDKRPEMIVLDFKIKGTIETQCDRCLEDIHLPVQGDQQIIVKYAAEKNDQAEIVYITKEDSSLNVAKYIHESIYLAIPLIKVYDCEEDENRICNEEMLSYLDRSEKVEEDKDDEDPGNSAWDALKDFGNN